MIWWGHGRALIGKVSENLRGLAHHLDEIASGARPTPDDLAEAPLIDEWQPRLTDAQAPAIRGRVFGHPLISEGETIRCDILAVDPDLAWVMTWAGFYRLGEEKVASVRLDEGARA